jgi:hypothetical protein
MFYNTEDYQRFFHSLILIFHCHGQADDWIYYLYIRVEYNNSVLCGSRLINTYLGESSTVISDTQIKLLKV